MKSISQIFKGNEHLMDLQPVEELIDYCQDLEEKVIETNLEENKEHIYKSIIQDILISCNELEESKLLAERYPDLYKKTDAETLVQNLKNYILDMNRINKLNI
jgi:predicted phage-related endonuclease